MPEKIVNNLTTWKDEIELASEVHFNTSLLNTSIASLRRSCR